MTQFARRDIIVTDVEIFELSKNKVSFKESKGGIIIKNKKFLFDGGGTEDSTIIVEDMMQPATTTTQQIIAATPDENGQYVNIEGKHPHNNGVRRPVDWVVFAPEPQQMLEIKQKSLRFTPEKKYPIFEKQISGVGEAYVMLDDAGREQLVSDKYFVPGNTQLFADKELGFSENQQSRDGGKLYWGGANSDPKMPEIRKK